MSTTHLTTQDPFVAALVDRLGSDPDVLGLVLCGSSAEPARRDRWSDHDFLVITADGTPERYRTDLSWLPEPDGIGLWFRETAHGLKVLYRSGLLVEFAVFDRAEFAGCALNHYAVVIDRGGIADSAADVHDRSLPPPAALDRLSQFRAFLCLVYIGTGRARRGERLSANVFLRQYAVVPLLRVVTDLLAPATAAALDALDPWRRFESAAPDLAAQIDAALCHPVDEVGAVLVESARAYLAPRWAQYPATETDLVLRLLARP